MDREEESECEQIILLFAFALRAVASFMSGKTIGYATF